jgi:hypothetical protein
MTRGSNFSGDIFYADSTVLGDRFIPTFNGFFRVDHNNVAHLAQTVIPQLITEGIGVDNEGRFLLAEVPSAFGEETWTIASILSAQGIDYRLYAFDINPHVIEKANDTNGLYTGTLAKLGQAAREWGISLDCIKYFEQVDSAHIRPVQALRARASFETLDLRKEPLPQRFGAVLVNELFGYYADAPDDIVRMLGNISAGMAIGAALCHKTYLPLPEEALSRAGLKLDANLSIDSISSGEVFRYQPNQKHTRLSRIRRFVNELWT